MISLRDSGKSIMRAGLVKAGFWPATNADRHLMWLKEQKLAYVRVPKAANSSVRIMLAKSFGLAEPNSRPANKDNFWQEVPSSFATSMTLKRFQLDPKTNDTWCFTIIRNPAARLYSCWNNKVIKNQSLSSDMERMGIRPQMSFPDFVDRVVQYGDQESDIHVRSLHSILCADDKIVPHFTGRLETIKRDWSHIRYEIKIRTGKDIGNLIERNVRNQFDTSFFDELPNKTSAQILERYADDFKRFYPDFWKQKANS